MTRTRANPDPAGPSWLPFIAALVGSLAAAFGVVIGVELCAGPFGDPLDGLFGMAVGALWVAGWSTVVLRSL